MDLQGCLTFATENPVCYLATVDGDQPRVRAVLMWFAHDHGFYFAILSPKDVSQQLHKNPKAEICFYNNPPDNNFSQFVSFGFFFFPFTPIDLATWEAFL